VEVEAMAPKVARLLLLVVVSLSFVSSPVHAQTAADLEVAKQQFMLGKTYYDQAAYGKALKHFQESFRLSKKADLLYNIARCFESLAQLAKAIEHYKLYLKKTGKTDATIEARIRNLEARLKANTPVKKDPVKDPVKKDPVKKDPLKKDPLKDPVKKDPATTPPPKTSTGFNWMKWTGWGLIGVGAGMLAMGIAFGVRATKRASQVEDAYARGDEWADVKDFADTGKTFETIGIIGIVVGIVAAGGGTALLLLAPTDESKSAAARRRRLARRAHIAPIITGNTVGLGGGFTF
jgi:tetratricopeptide (TPR) repeat protein